MTNTLKQEFQFTRRYFQPATDDERRTVARAMTRAFNFPMDNYPEYFNYAGHENIRAVRDSAGENVVGGLVIIPMGQFFGGRSIPMAGIAAVAIDPAGRGGGSGSHMMQSVVRELHARRFPLSALYPATQPLYRRVGYEQAGFFFKVRMSLQAIDVRCERDELQVREATEGDHEGTHALSTRRGRMNNGHLDRSDYIWHRIRNSRLGETRSYVVHPPGRPDALEGCVSIVQVASPPGGSHKPYHLVLTDLITETPTAARRILSLLADHRSVAGNVIFTTAPTEPVYMILREQIDHCESMHKWMLRVLDVRSALEARGYPSGITGSFDIEVHSDAVLSEANNRRFRLQVDGNGQAEVKVDAGRGTIRIGINALATLYSGLHSPLQLRQMNLLDGEAAGDEAILRSFGALFAGPLPWTPDFF